MSGETLRKAAQLMRERAKAATPGPWRVSGHDVVNEYEQIAETWLKVDAEHIAGMHRGVALAVADWLDFAAQNFGYRGEAEAAHAFAVARAYLGGEA